MTEIGLGHYLTLGAVIFSIGVIGIFLNRKNIIVILMSIAYTYLRNRIVYIKNFWFVFPPSNHNYNFNKNKSAYN